VMTTIANFEHNLGRKVLWSPRQLFKTGVTTEREVNYNEDNGKYDDNRVRRCLQNNLTAAA